MPLQRQLATLIDLAESLDITVRCTPPRAGGADSSGGALVYLKGEQILFLDPTAPLTDQIAAVAGALRGREELEQRFISPEVRQWIETGG